VIALRVKKFCKGNWLDGPLQRPGQMQMTLPSLQTERKMEEKGQQQVRRLVPSAALTR
jgi:hypothetical protein